jgi:hypothetical protein
MKRQPPGIRAAQIPAGRDERQQTGNQDEQQLRAGGADIAGATEAEGGALETIRKPGGVPRDSRGEAVARQSIEDAPASSHGTTSSPGLKA